MTEHEELHDAIEAFKQIKKYATKDRPFLQVYSEDNQQLYVVSEKQYTLVLDAALRDWFKRYTTTI